MRFLVLIPLAFFPVGLAAQDRPPSIMGVWPGMNDEEIARELKFPDDWRERWCTPALQSSGTTCTVHGSFPGVDQHPDAVFTFGFDSREDRSANSVSMTLPIPEQALILALEHATSILNRLLDTHEPTYVGAGPCYVSRTLLGQVLKATVEGECHPGPAMNIDVRERAHLGPVEDRTAEPAELVARNRPAAVVGRAVRVGSCSTDRMLFLSSEPGGTANTWFSFSNQCGEYAPVGEVLDVEGDWVRVGMRRAEGWVHLMYLNPQLSRVPPPSDAVRIVEKP